MTEEKFLFIGGSHDGQRHHMGERMPFVQLLKKIDSAPRFSPFRHVRQLDDEIEEYKLTDFAGNDAIFYVYALSGLSPSDVIAALISKYPTQEVQALARRTRRR